MRKTSIKTANPRVGCRTVAVAVRTVVRHAAVAVAAHTAVAERKRVALALLVADGRRSPVAMAAKIAHPVARPAVAHQ